MDITCRRIVGREVQTLRHQLAAGRAQLLLRGRHTTGVGRRRIERRVRQAAHRASVAVDRHRVGRTHRDGVSQIKRHIVRACHLAHHDVAIRVAQVHALTRIHHGRISTLRRQREAAAVDRIGHITSRRQRIRRCWRVHAAIGCRLHFAGDRRNVAVGIDCRGHTVGLRRHRVRPAAVGGISRRRHAYALVTSHRGLGRCQLIHVHRIRACNTRCHVRDHGVVGVDAARRHARAIGHHKAGIGCHRTREHRRISNLHVDRACRRIRHRLHVGTAVGTCRSGLTHDTQRLTQVTMDITCRRIVGREVQTCSSQAIVHVLQVTHVDRIGLHRICQIRHRVASRIRDTAGHVHDLVAAVVQAVLGQAHVRRRVCRGAGNRDARRIHHRVTHGYAAIRRQVDVLGQLHVQRTRRRISHHANVAVAQQGRIGHATHHVQRATQRTHNGDAGVIDKRQRLIDSLVQTSQCVTHVVDRGRGASGRIGCDGVARCFQRAIGIERCTTAQCSSRVAGQITKSLVGVIQLAAIDGIGTGRADQTGCHVLNATFCTRGTHRNHIGRRCVACVVVGNAFDGFAAVGCSTLGSRSCSVGGRTGAQDHIVTDGSGDSVTQRKRVFCAQRIVVTHAVAVVARHDRRITKGTRMVTRDLVAGTNADGLGAGCLGTMTQSNSGSATGLRSCTHRHSI